MSNPNDFVIENGVLKEYQGAGGDVVIPDSVTSIGDSAFSDCKKMKSVTIPDSVTSIGWGAFSGCKKLKNVTIPGSVTSIDNNAFEYCTTLTNVTIPSSVTFVGKGAFSNCRGLTSVHITDLAAWCSIVFSLDASNPLDYAHNLYLNGKSITDLVIPESVTKISDYAFCGCTCLTSVTIPDSVTHIGSSAFNGCTALTNVTIPDSVTIIGTHAFNGCAGLTSVTIPASVKRIGYSAFSDCTGLTSLTVPDSITTIDSSAFNGIPNLVYHGSADGSPWGACALNGYEEYPFIYTDSSKTSLLSCFSTYTGEAIIPDSVTSVGRLAFSGCSGLTRVIIPSGVVSIGSSAFGGCTGLTSVTIPSSVTSIGSYAFDKCEGLTRVDISDLSAWCAIEFYDYKSSPLYYAPELYLNDVPVTDLVIPDGVKSIAAYAFYGCSGMKSVTFSASVKEIGKEAFRHCKNLSSVVNLPLDVKLAEEAFDWDFYSPRKFSKDYPLLAAAFFSKSAKSFTKECEACLCKDPEAAALAMLDVLKGKGKDKHYQKASNFFLEHRKQIGDDLLKTLYEQAVTDKAKETAESLKPLVKDDTQPEATGGREIETFCRKNFSEQLLDETVKKQKINAQVFDTVKYKDNGEPAPAFVVKCAVIPYIDQLKENPKHISDYKWDYSRFTICKEADRAAAELEESSFLAVLTKLARISLEGRRYDCSHAYWSPAMLLPLCRYASGALVNDLASTMRREWVSWDQYAAKGRTAIIITRGALLLNDSREAILFAEKEKCLDYYAQIRDTDAETLRSTRMIDFGFNADGKILYDLGSTVIEATLGDDLAISLYDTAAGKTVKSLPKRGAEETKYNECAAAFAEFKKNYKKIIKARNDLLFESFLNGRAVKAKIWQEAYLGNPVLNKVARLIVWSQSGKTFTLGRDGLIDSTGAAFILQKDYDIAVAHPIEMQDDDVARWQRYFTARQLKQPFEQVWEPKLVKSEISEDRYKGIYIPYYRFLHQEKHGITVFDTNYHNDITVCLADCSAKVNRVDWARHEISPDDRFEVASIVPKSQSRAANHILYYLDKCTIYGKLERDEVESLPDLNGYTAAQLSAFLSFSIEHNAAKCTAVLLDYKNEHFADFSAMDEFTLDL